MYYVIKGKSRLYFYSAPLAFFLYVHGIDDYVGTWKFPTTLIRQMTYISVTIHPSMNWLGCCYPVVISFGIIGYKCD